MELLHLYEDLKNIGFHLKAAARVNGTFKKIAHTACGSKYMYICIHAYIYIICVYIYICVSTYAYRSVSTKRKCVCPYKDTRALDDFARECV